MHKKSEEKNLKKYVNDITLTFIHNYVKVFLKNDDAFSMFGVI